MSEEDNLEAKIRRYIVGEQKPEDFISFDMLCGAYLAMKERAEKAEKENERLANIIKVTEELTQDVQDYLSELEELVKS